MLTSISARSRVRVAARACWLIVCAAAPLCQAGVLLNDSWTDGDRYSDCRAHRSRRAASRGRSARPCGCDRHLHRS